jgi:LacI family transcriptional regulator
MSLSKETQFKADFHHISVIDQECLSLCLTGSLMKFYDKVIIDDKQAAYGSKPDRQRKKENRARHHR